MSSCHRPSRPFFGAFQFRCRVLFFRRLLWRDGATIYGSTSVRLNLIWPEYSKFWARSGDPCLPDLGQVGLSLPTYRGKHRGPCRRQGLYFRDMIRASRPAPGSREAPAPRWTEHGQTTSAVSQSIRVFDPSGNPQFAEFFPRLASPSLCSPAICYLTTLLFFVCYLFAVLVFVLVLFLVLVVVFVACLFKRHVNMADFWRAQNNNKKQQRKQKHH